MNRENAWKEIWTKKYKSYRDHEYLHVAAGYDGLSYDEWKKLTRFFIDKLRFSSNDDVLEVGCGCGAFLKEIENQVASLSGVDYSLEAIERISEELSGNFQVSRADKLHFDNEKFDVILSFGVFFYFETIKYAELVLDEMLLNLKPNGKIFIGEISDLDKKQLAEELRQTSDENRESHRVSKISADHLYYPQSFFSDYANRNNLSCEFIEQDVPQLSFYYNAKYRFSVILSRVGD